MSAWLKAIRSTLIVRQLGDSEPVWRNSDPTCRTGMHNRTR